MSQQAHHESVAAAKQLIGEVQEMISAATDRADHALRAVAEATGTGGATATEAGLNSYRMTSLIDVHLQEAFAAAATAVEELSRYAGGF
jgi:hypothetical protein